jgi:hypothetical protein
MSSTQLEPSALERLPVGQGMQFGKLPLLYRPSALQPLSQLGRPPRPLSHTVRITSAHASDCAADAYPCAQG